MWIIDLRYDISHIRSPSLKAFFTLKASIVSHQAYRGQACFQHSVMSSSKMFNNMKQCSSVTLPAPNPKVGAFHRTLPHYNHTPLVSLPEIAEELGIGHLLLKDEGSRLGLPAFKILGASWATVQAISKTLRLGFPEQPNGASSSA